ncbi:MULTISPECIES: NAD-dependent epimerase/dehydratase family protein [unclassified Polaribacter]|uniref:NAD-dependent epimerase/dehydratase family protein n=1 Tax=unclassified Polaribacter TaxID=196858 RepID=UPI0011BDDF7F|nr:MULTISPECIES: NAD-dependent epimerase/dehydratase family protein [unclassified Polaribacter]TXD52524.1 NAD-dependent epimerase/dehydratase family protein [Polaribacter sp. IC063]TXD60510.1 NAD-dependent epimerase/dehydratase family protein [Polaribacter sp. IC066]
MQIILGANGIIGEELASELRVNYTDKIKLVGRNPKKVNTDDLLFQGDLLKPEDVNNALKHCEIAYLTVGLPYNSAVWLRDWPKIMHNVIAGCKANNCKLVYFDNTYAYPQGSKIQKENTPLKSEGKKGKAKKIAAQLLLLAIKEKKIDAVICRAPEFYGPGKTKGITNTLIFKKLKITKKPKLFLKDNVLRTLIYAPDASKAMALIGNTPDAFGQTWHLPCDDYRLTYKEILEEISKQLGRTIQYDILNSVTLKIASFFNNDIKETQELLPRYKIDNLFYSSKFKKKFPDFNITTYQQGIKNILEDYQIK